MKRVEIVSQDKFNYQRDALEPPRARSFTEAGFPPPSPPITTVPPTALSPSAEVFRPRANTAPTEPLSRSLPTGVPESPNKELTRHGSRTPKRKDVKVAPRFFPAFSKENVSDQVRLFLYSMWISVYFLSRFKQSGIDRIDDIVPGSAIGTDVTTKSKDTMLLWLACWIWDRELNKLF